MPSDTVTLPPCPKGLELKRDAAIAALVIKKGVSIQEAADRLGSIMSEADTSIKRAVHG